MIAPETNVMVSELAGDPDLLDLVELFVRDLPGRVQSLRNALQAGDFATMRRLSHQLKGSAGGYGFPRITEAAKTLEGLVRQPGHAADIRRALDHLADLCAQARATSA